MLRSVYQSSSWPCNCVSRITGIILLLCSYVRFLPGACVEHSRISLVEIVISADRFASLITWSRVTGAPHIKWYTCQFKLHSSMAMTLQSDRTIDLKTSMLQSSPARVLSTLYSQKAVVFIYFFIHFFSNWFLFSHVFAFVFIFCCLHLAGLQFSVFPTFALKLELVSSDNRVSYNLTIYSIIIIVSSSTPSSSSTSFAFLFSSIVVTSVKFLLMNSMRFFCKFVCVSILCMHISFFHFFFLFGLTYKLKKLLEKTYM